MIIQILNALQIALYIILPGVVALVLLMIASYVKEELEYHPNAKVWYPQLMTKIKELEKTMIVELLVLCCQLMVEIDEYQLEMSRRRKEARKAKIRAKKERIARESFIEDGFGYFDRGFDKTGVIRYRRGIIVPPEKAMVCYREMRDTQPGQDSKFIKVFSEEF